MISEMPLVLRPDTQLYTDACKCFHYITLSRLNCKYKRITFIKQNKWEFYTEVIVKRLTADKCARKHICGHFVYTEYHPSDQKTPNEP